MPKTLMESESQILYSRQPGDDAFPETPEGARAITLDTEKIETVIYMAAALSDHQSVEMLLLLAAAYQTVLATSRNCDDPIPEGLVEEIEQAACSIAKSEARNYIATDKEPSL